MSLEIHVVESKKQWKQFFELRRAIYKDQPNAVFPLNFMERSMLDTDKHPFYQHAIRQAFLCLKDGQPVGRIVAIKDHLHNEHYGDKLGFFGFFESPNDQTIADSLLGAARNWLLENGCDAMRGPVNPSMKSDFGVLVQGHDDPPFIMMAYTHGYYEQLLLAAGFECVRSFNAYLYDKTKSLKDAKAQTPDLLRMRDKILKKYPQITYGACTKENFESALREINVIGNEIRSDGWGFVPMTDAELDFMVKQVKRVIRPDMMMVARWEGEIAGYIVCVPDINWALQRAKGKSDWVRLPQFLYWMKKTDRLRLIAVGATKRHRKRGIGSLLSIQMHFIGADETSQFDYWEFSWIDSENVASIRNMHRSIPCEHSKTLRLYEQSLIG